MPRLQREDKLAHTLIIVAFIFIVSTRANTAGVSTRSSSSTAHPSGILGWLEHLAGLWARPKQPTTVMDHLPSIRPIQPWPYRHFGAALHHSVVTTVTHALVASVTHEPLPGVTADMMQWWLSNIEGEAVYAGDGKVWSKYIQWHPRDHVYQAALSPSGRQDSHSDAAAASPRLWEICEFFMCREAGGYTLSNYHQGFEQSTEYFVQAVTEVQQLDHKTLRLTVPSRTGLGSTLWRLQHMWQDSPQGLLINSTQIVGVIEPAWRPMWFARLRNALVRGLYAQGRDPEWMLAQWLHHCVEEIGNLPHILPSLYAAATGGDVKASTHMHSDGATSRSENVQADTGHADEL